MEMNLTYNELMNKIVRQPHQTREKCASAAISCHSRRTLLQMPIHLAVHVAGTNSNSNTGMQTVTTKHIRYHSEGMQTVEKNISYKSMGVC